MSPQERTASGRAIGKLAALAGLDADVLHTLVYRFWSIMAGAVTILLIPACLSEAEQGYYYTFSSLLALQIFFDLGMNQVILQLISHNAAHGNSSENKRLAMFAAMIRRWYAVAAIVFLVAVGAAGAWFLGRAPVPAPAHWEGPWVSLMLGTAANLYLGAMLAVHEGVGRVAKVAQLRFRQSVLGHLTVWTGLALGAGLWAAALLPAVCAACSTWWLRAQAASFRRDSASADANGSDMPSWRRDIFPLQWRNALSWISGYFIFQLLTPIVFARHGAVEAGRLGITLAVFNAVLTTGMSWVNAKFPTLSMHLARNERIQANALFRVAATRALAFVALTSAALLALLLTLDGAMPALAERFASAPVTACIAAITLANTFVFAAASYLRAHKEEPMLAVSLVSGLVVLGAISTGSALGVLLMMALYMAVTLLVPLPWTLILFRRYYRRPA